MCANGKSKKVKVGPTIEDANVKDCRRQSQQRGTVHLGGT
jgi:hypothetical protein